MPQKFIKHSGCLNKGVTVKLHVHVFKGKRCIVPVHRPSTVLLIFLSWKIKSIWSPWAQVSDFLRYSEVKRIIRKPILYILCLFLKGISNRLRETGHY